MDNKQPNQSLAIGLNVITDMVEFSDFGRTLARFNIEEMFAIQRCAR